MIATHLRFADFRLKQIIEARKNRSITNHNRNHQCLCPKGRPILGQNPARQVFWSAPFNGNYNIRIPGPGVVAVIIRGPRRVIGVGVVIAQHVKPARPRTLFHAQLVERINQETVLLRFPARVVQGQKLLRAAGVVPQVGERHNFRHLLRVAIGFPQQIPRSTRWDSPARRAGGWIPIAVCLVEEA